MAHGVYVYVFAAADGSGCADRHCRAGRVCRDSVCVCASPADCDAVTTRKTGRHHQQRGRGAGGHHHRAAVCGSDGRWYTNHCHLHRTACVSGRRLKVNRRSDACGVLPATTEGMYRVRQNQIELKCRFSCDARILPAQSEQTGSSVHFRRSLCMFLCTLHRHLANTLQLIEIISTRTA